MTKKRKITYTLLGVILIAICAGGLFFWNNKKQATQDLSKSNLPKNYIELDKNYNKAERIIKYAKPYEPLLIAGMIRSQCFQMNDKNDTAFYKGDYKTFERDITTYVKKHYKEVEIKGLSDTDKQSFLISDLEESLAGVLGANKIYYEDSKWDDKLENMTNSVQSDGLRFALGFAGGKLKEKIGNNTDYETIVKAMGYDRKRVIAEVERTIKEDESADFSNNSYLKAFTGTEIWCLISTPKFHYYYNEINDTVTLVLSFVPSQSSGVAGELNNATNHQSYTSSGPTISVTLDSKGNASVGQEGTQKITDFVSAPLNLPKFTPNNLDLDKLPTKEYIVHLSNQLFNIKYEQDDTVFANSYPIGEDVKEQLPHYATNSSDYDSDNKVLDKNSVVPFQQDDSDSSTIITSDDVLPEYDSFINDTCKYLIIADNNEYMLTFKNKVLINIELYS